MASATAGTFELNCRNRSGLRRLIRFVLAGLSGTAGLMSMQVAAAAWLPPSLDMTEKLRLAYPGGEVPQDVLQQAQPPQSKPTVTFTPPTAMRAISVFIVAGGSLNRDERLPVSCCL